MVIVAIAIGAITASYVWWLNFLTWALLVALIGWVVFAVLERRRHSD